jgi:hypothetical protein
MEKMKYLSCKVVFTLQPSASTLYSSHHTPLPPTHLNPISIQLSLTYPPPFSEFCLQIANALILSAYALPSRLSEAGSALSALPPSNGPRSSLLTFLSSLLTAFGQTFSFPLSISTSSPFTHTLPISCVFSPRGNPFLLTGISVPPINISPRRPALARFAQITSEMKSMSLPIDLHVPLPSFLTSVVFIT